MVNDIVGIWLTLMGSDLRILSNCNAYSNDGPAAICSPTLT